MIEAFLAYLQVERRMSPHTLDAYRRDLAALSAWAEAGQGGDVVRLDGEQLRAFVSAEHRRGLSPKSLQRRLSACRSFYVWLLKHGHITASPAAKLRAPKAPRKLPQVLDADEAVRLVEVPTDAPLGLRDRALMELFYSSGLRLSELCALRWRDLDLAEGLVNVLGKGGKQRRVPVGTHARRALAEWRVESHPRDALAMVFPGRNGAQISARAVQIRIKQLALRQGCSSTRTRTCCGTASPAISSNRPATCVACRATGAFGHRHHPDLHPPRFPAPGQGLRCGASARASKKTGRRNAGRVLTQRAPGNGKGSRPAPSRPSNW